MGTDEAVDQPSASRKRGFSAVCLQPVEVLGAVAREVEVDVRDRLLHEAPHRLAKIRHEAHQDVAVEVGSAVGREQLAVAGVVQPVRDGEVREVEGGVTHAGVLPVDDPEPLAGVDEVRRQQVVVARNERDRPRRRLDPVGDRLRSREPGREGDSVRAGDLRVSLDDPEGVEPPGDRRRSVEPAQERRRRRRRHPSGLALDETCHQIALGLQERDDLGPDSEAGTRRARPRARHRGRSRGAPCPCRRRGARSPRRPLGP